MIDPFLMEAEPSARLGAGVRFPNPVVPEQDESILGLLCRAGQINGFSRTSQLCSILGITRNKGQPGTARFDDRSYADLVGVDLDWVESRSRSVIVDNDDARRTAAMNGVMLRRKYLFTSRRRVSPASLRLSLHHRWHWDLKPVPVCVVGGDRLISACPGCGRHLGWTCTHLELCGSANCRFDLRDAASEPEEESEVDLARAMTDLFHHDATSRLEARRLFPDQLRQLTASDLLDLAIFFGLHSDISDRPLSNRRRDVSLGSFTHWTARELAAGVEVLLGWPASVERMADTFVETADQRFGRFGLRKFLGPLADVIQRDAFSFETVGVVERAVSAHVAARPEVVLRPGENQRLRPDAIILTMSDAAKKYGIGIERIAALPDRWGMMITGSGGKGMPVVVDEARIKEAVKRYRDMVTPAAVRKNFGLDEVTQSRLVTAGYLLRADGPERDLRVRQVDYLRRSSVEGLMDRLDAMAIREPSGGSTLALALLPAVGSGDARADVLISILQGKLRLLRVDPGHRQVGSRLIVDHTEVQAMLLRDGTVDAKVTMLFAAQALGLKWEVAKDLFRFLDLPTVRSGRANWVRTADLRQIGETYITGSEVARRLGTIARHVPDRLARVGIRPVIVLRARGQHFYERAAVLEKTMPAGAR